MQGWLLEHEASVLGVVYFLSLAIIATWEGHAPLRRASTGIGVRWANNFALAIGNSLLLRALFPGLTIGVAYAAAQADIGLFNRMDLPGGVTFVASFLLLDFAFYLTHVVLHKVPWFWRIHRSHHDDPDFDFATGFRFHPIEALYRFAVDALAILAFGIPPFAVLLRDLLFIVINLFVHANVGLPGRIERWLRMIIVTPDFHRVHHSADAAETDRNYSGILSCWDRLFGTYLAQPMLGHQAMVIGLREFRENKHLWLHWMLINPLLSAPPRPTPEQAMTIEKR